MSTLVTGAAGFVGRHLVRALVASGKEVVGVDNFATSAEVDLHEILDLEGFRFEPLDVRSAAFRQFGQQHGGFDAIYHLACPTGVHNLVPMALEMLETCYEGTKAVLDIARDSGASVLLASSAEVYGNPEVSPQRETYTGNVDPLGPRKGYEEGKRVAETLCGIYQERYGVPTHIARLFNTYGPGMSMADTRVVPSFVRAAIEGSPLTMYGDGQQTRCHTYVSDMVEGLQRVMTSGTDGQPYNLGSQREETIAVLAELVIATAGSASEICQLPRPGHDHDRRLPDVSRAAAELDWRTTVSLEAGIEKTVSNFRSRLSAGSTSARH